jgi:hypothetical protein
MLGILLNAWTLMSNKDDDWTPMGNRDKLCAYNHKNQRGKNHIFL